MSLISISRQLLPGLSFQPGLIRADGRSNEGWEKIWTFGMGAGIAIIVLGHIYSPAATCVPPA